jgi:PPK2 family polyphosphate:nucleotide phosphotransferase
MEKYKISDTDKFKLAHFDPDETDLWSDGKKEAKKEINKMREELIDLQRTLYAENKHKLLIVLQAIDAGGKDGTIRSIFKGVNPQGVKVAGFKVPTEEEISHDYLWRIHKHTPRNGEIVIFNRSHYEDVLVVRVHQLVPEKRWQKRYHHIREFEKLLSDEGTTILKIFLHISLDEQKERFMERIEMKEKQWKFNPGDLEERKLWGKYMGAFQQAIRETSTDYAPWYVIPANRNWYRDYVVTSIIVDTLRKLKMKYPNPIEDIEKYKPLLLQEE